MLSNKEIARIIGEVGLGIGTITGTAYAVQYGSELTNSEDIRQRALSDKKTAEDAKTKAETEKTAAIKTRDETFKETIIVFYELNEYLQDQHRNELSKIKETGNQVKALTEIMNLFNGCIKNHNKKVTNYETWDKCKTEQDRIKNLIINKDSKYKYNEQN